MAPPAFLDGSPQGPRTTNGSRKQGLFLSNKWAVAPECHFQIVMNNTVYCKTLLDLVALHLGLRPRLYLIHIRSCGT